MNRNQIPIVYVLLAVLLLCACVPTPEVEPVPNKGDNIMEQVVHTTPIPDETSEQGFVVPDFSAPSHWTESFSVGNTQIDVDAEITFPESPYPIYLIRAQDHFDGVKLKKLMNLFVSATKWREMGTTREDLIDALQRAIRGQSTGEDNPETHEPIYEPYEGQQEDIDRIMKRLQEIDPETAWNDLSELPAGSGILTDEEEKRSAYFDQDQGHTFLIKESKNAYTQPELWVQQGDALYDGEKAHDLPEPDMSKERAIELARFVLAQIDMDDELDVVNVYKSRRIEERKELGVGWTVECMRRIKGAEAFSTEAFDYDSGPLRVDLTEYAPKNGRNELISLYFEDDELKQAIWNCPQTIISEENAAVSLLPFETIQDNIRNRFRFGLSWLEGRDLNERILIRHIALTYQRVEKSGIYTKDDYYAPVWTVVFTSDAPTGIPVMPYLLFFNAVDGTYVRLTGEY